MVGPLRAWRNGSVDIFKIAPFRAQHRGREACGCENSGQRLAHARRHVAPAAHHDARTLRDELQHVGRFDEAIAVATSALVFDPLSSGLNLTLGRAYLHAGRPAEALQPLKTAVEIAPGFAFAHLQMGHALLQLGRSAEALDAFRRAAVGGGPMEAGQLAFALATTGDRVGAEAVVRDLLAMEATRYLPPFGVACAYAGLGDLDAAFAWLNRGIDEHAAHMNTIRVVPALYPLHGDRRWREVLARMGWPSPS
jgi:tetratricopeptide (TPR) repeat protein